MAPLVMEPHQPPAHRLSLTCDRHPDENFTGFCTSCLSERLSSLEAASTTSTTHSNSTSTISFSFKSIFVKPASSSFSTLQPELRRCKSFSCGRGNGLSGPRLSTSFEPHHRSCDIRGCNTLWSLFNQDNNTTVGSGAHSLASSSSATAAASSTGGGVSGQIEGDGDKITAVDPVIVVETSGEIEERDEASDLKPMKDHMDLESQAKKPPAATKDLREIAGSFWLAASVFSKKLQKWRRKQKLKKMKKHEGRRKPDDARSSSRRFRETQSEIAVDTFGRWSCDLDPRFLLDAGRISCDAPRYSFDEPRASWDGHLIGGGGGGRSVLSRAPPMLSVVEDSPTLVVQRTDGEISVEEDSTVPGRSTQTKDYYSDSSSRNRKWSLDRSNSVKKLSVEVNEAKPVSNAKVSPAGSTEFFRDWSSNSLRDDRSESFESAFRVDSSHKLPPRKKSKKWNKAWRIWEFIHWRSGSQDGGNVVDRSFSESWPELRTNGYHCNGRFQRSNSSVSSRSSIGNASIGNASIGNAGFGSMRNGLETNGIGKKRRDEFVLERNRSARYSPGHINNGMLRFYLTPMRGSLRGSGKGKPNNCYHSFARRVLQLY